MPPVIKLWKCQNIKYRCNVGQCQTSNRFVKILAAPDNVWWTDTSDNFALWIRNGLMYYLLKFVSFRFKIKTGKIIKNYYFEIVYTAFFDEVFHRKKMLQGYEWKTK